MLISPDCGGSQQTIPRSFFDTASSLFQAGNSDRPKMAMRIGALGKLPKLRFSFGLALAALLLVGFPTQQSIKLARVGHLYLHDPTRVVGIAVKRFQLVGQRVIHFDYLP